MTFASIDKKHKNENLVSIKDLSKKLAVSEATVRNWIKLNKINPDIITDNKIFFTQEYSDLIVKRLQSDESNLLKARRNKKYLTGNFFYKDYISCSSKNIDTITELLDKITSKKISLSKKQIKYIIADCAIQLLLKEENPNIQKNYLNEYLRQNLSLGIYAELTDDLIENTEDAINFTEKNSDIFLNYVYEKDEDILGLLYISLSNLNNRKAKGAYYTPTKIVKKVINRICFNDFSEKKIIDPCCGGGNFLLQLPDSLNIEQIYGNDTDDVAVCITRLNMALKFQIKNVEILYKNFTNKDFLTENFNSEFDYIIGNPPWGADFDQITVNRLEKKYLTAKNKNIESYDVFTERSLSCLKKGGQLLFILPESVLYVKNHQIIRQIILNNNSVKYIEFLGNMFDKVQCPSIILQIQRTNSLMSCVGMKIADNCQEFTIQKERQLTSEVFDFYMNDKEYSVYKKILCADKKVYLKNNAIFALGIVTGDNKKYITDVKTEFNEIVLKGSDIEKYKIKIPQKYIEYKPDSFQQVAPTELYRAKEKLFYRFISKKLVFAYDNKQTLSLNSCNIVIPKIKNYNIKYIMAILNSKIAQFIFEKKYNSIKVLRAHIENIPIPVCDYDTQEDIVKIVDRILKDENNSKNNLHEILEEKISKLYNLEQKEYNLIKNY